jgi:hypothetical protein
VYICFKIDIMKSYKETRKILSDMLEASPKRMRGYVFVMSNDIYYPYKTFKRIKIIKMILCPKQEIYYCPNPMWT